VLRCVVWCLQVSAEQGRVSQLQAENAAGRSELDNLRSTVSDLRQQLEGAQAAKVRTRQEKRPYQCVQCAEAVHTIASQGWQVLIAHGILKVSAACVSG
jgi:ribosomal protein L9